MRDLAIFLTFFLTPIFVAAAAPPVVWSADLAPCRAEFTVSHMVVSKVWGHVPVRQLTIVNTSGTPVPRHLEVLLDVTHEDTDNHERDADLRSATYFDVAKYPTMTFRSTSIVSKDASNFSVTGDLTIKNVTKPVTFPVHVVGDYSGSRRLARRLLRAAHHRPARLGTGGRPPHAGRRSAGRLQRRYRPNGRSAHERSAAASADVAAVTEERAGTGAFAAKLTA